MPVKGSNLLKFCVNALDGRFRKYINFYWIDRKRGRFVLECSNRKNKTEDWICEHCAIFLDYARSCRRQSNDESNPRQRMLSALHKSKFLKKISLPGEKRRKYEIKTKYLNEYLFRTNVNSAADDCLFDITEDLPLDLESFFGSGCETSPSSEGGVDSPSSVAVGGPPSPPALDDFSDGLIPDECLNDPEAFLDLSALSQLDLNLDQNQDSEKEEITMNEIMASGDFSGKEDFLENSNAYQMESSASIFPEEKDMVSAEPLRLTSAVEEVRQVDIIQLAKLISDQIPTMGAGNLCFIIVQQPPPAAM